MTFCFRFLKLGKIVSHQCRKITRELGNIAKIRIMAIPVSIKSQGWGFKVVRTRLDFEKNTHINS